MIQEKTIRKVLPFDEYEQKLMRLVDEHATEIMELAKQLIDIESINSDAEIFVNLSQIKVFIEDFFNSAEISTKIYPSFFTKEPPQSYPNIIARIESKKTPSQNEHPLINQKKLQFLGHMDVVPYTPEDWAPDTPPHQGTIKNNRLYGRGALDMKGGVAAQMMAMKLFKLAESFLPNHGLLQMYITPDEETDGRFGAQFMAHHHKEVVTANASIIAEPTGQPPILSPAIIIGEKAAIWLKFTFFGASGHGSQPKIKSNAINKAARFITYSKRHLKFKKITPPMTKKDLIEGLFSRYTLRNLIKRMKNENPETSPELYNDDGSTLSAFFGTSLSFTQIRAGTKINVIPDRCELELDIRILPGITPQDVMDDIARYSTKLGYRINFPPDYRNWQENQQKLQSRPIDIKVETISANIGRVESHQSEICQILAQSFEQIYHTRALYFFSPGMTDAAHLRRYGLENIVVFGPGGENAHDANEFVYLHDLINCTKIYLLSAYRFLCSP